MTARTCLSAMLTGILALAGCASEPTDYADRLRSTISTDAVLDHLLEFQHIANENAATRQTGTPGYTASVDYVVKTLRDSGFDVETPEFELAIFQVDAESLTLKGTPTQARAVEYSASTPPTGVTGPLVILPAGRSLGCAATDYEGLPIRGAVVLVDRGDCYLSEKAAVATEHGAKGLIVANDVDEKAFSGALLESDHVTIPVMSMTKTEGDWLRRQGGGDVTMTVDAHQERRSAKNVIAQTATGSTQDVVVVGAHLDSVRLSAGINDNASGVTALLQIAHVMGSAPEIRNAVRFAFFGGEEEWLVGSDSYVKSLDVEALKDIALYVNLDMIGSENAGYFTLDGNLSGTPDPEFASMPAGSEGIEQAFADALKERGITTQDLPVDGRGDYNAFLSAGIPVGQLFTGAEAPKTYPQQELWGGKAAEPFDPNYHSPDDTVLNVNRHTLDNSLPAIGYVVGHYADGAETGIPQRGDRQRHVLNR